MCIRDRPIHVANPYSGVGGPFRVSRCSGFSLRYTYPSEHCLAGRGVNRFPTVSGLTVGTKRASSVLWRHMRVCITSTAETCTSLEFGDWPHPTARLVLKRAPPRPHLNKVMSLTNSLCFYMS